MQVAVSRGERHGSLRSDLMQGKRLMVRIEAKAARHDYFGCHLVKNSWFMSDKLPPETRREQLMVELAESFDAVRGGAGHDGFAGHVGKTEIFKATGRRQVCKHRAVADWLGTTTATTLGVVVIVVMVVVVVVVMMVVVLQGLVVFVRNRTELVFG